LFFFWRELLSGQHAKAAQKPKAYAHHPDCRPNGSSSPQAYQANYPHNCLAHPYRPRLAQQDQTSMFP
jgi:hypothetical protein